MRTMLLLLLCLLLPLSGALAAPAVSIPDDAQILSLLYPGEPFEALPNFFYTNQQVDPGLVSPDLYGSRMLYQVKETKRIDGQLLVVVQSLGSAHAEGYMNHAFAMLDLYTQSIVGDVLRFHGDASDYFLGCRDGVPSVLCIHSSTYQGMEAFGGGRYEWRDAQWVNTWPEGDPSEYWTRRKGVIRHLAPESPGGLDIYQMQFPEGPREDMSDYSWAYETSLFYE